MQLTERIFHSVLFEIGAIIVTAIAVLLVGQGIDMGTAIGTGLVISLIAMVWNLVFNYWFDKHFTGKRENRSFGLRVLHTVTFELGLLFFTIPLIAYLLNLSWWHALVADIGLSLLIMAYALIFNWIYDVTRVKIVQLR